MSTLRLFEAYGIEIEHMIVDRQSLDLRPVADRLLEAEAGVRTADVEREDMAWSNELVLHVIEFKTNGPASSLHGLARKFHAETLRADELLAPLGCRLMPTGAHPWMDPLTETHLWPHECGVIYQTYDRVFSCKGHGWSNLQSMHINLPFADDEEFARLHAAIRLLMPLMPALTASTPVLDGRATGFLDTRMDYYARNSARVPSVTGLVVPEQVASREEYDRIIMQPMFADMAPLDPEGVLREEFLNARGSIARFGRGSIEIRVLDAQECPQADLAAAGLICAALEALCDGRLGDLDAQARLSTEALAAILARVTREADTASVEDAEYLKVLGYPGGPGVRAGEVWSWLAETCLPTAMRDPDWEEPLAVMLGRGCLARRILEALGPDFGRGRLLEVYAELCDCLEGGRPFRP
ncbi:carboxylate-amine ligase [Desulfocurvibacter africanus]|uniref:Glutamate--cysteine ligase GCS2 n=1 Tax=Desulfocurvibacter africanus subsp. africanus str. Walvis Bay TaxID=690850 RepID=F3YYN0_DESAF|nr:glutamate-cysteine ligase family protein [Desulfocurvibacter africanus]EGJ50784.1 glutamate--cysteine ligase GCS2 [Desulfocurvibacter africanus subsp. africanus str. Walvis Bay]